MNNEIRKIIYRNSDLFRMNNVILHDALQVNQNGREKN